jgi:hypothetical protein
MKIKIVGFKVGQSRPTANRTFEHQTVENDPYLKEGFLRLGQVIFEVMDESDFISIRRVND